MDQAHIVRELVHAPLAKKQTNCHFSIKMSLPMFWSVSICLFLCFDYILKLNQLNIIKERVDRKSLRFEIFCYYPRNHPTKSILTQPITTRLDKILISVTFTMASQSENFHRTFVTMKKTHAWLILSLTTKLLTESAGSKISKSSVRKVVRVVTPPGITMLPLTSTRVCSSSSSISGQTDPESKKMTTGSESRGHGQIFFEGAGGAAFNY